MRRFVTALTAASVLGLGFASAAEARVDRVKLAVMARTAAAFRQVDADRNRSISPAEFTAAGKNAENFDAIDANDDGGLGYFEVLRAVIFRLRNR
ncbi:hypothetical protein IP88_11925 [alpha proteobacterium AAP81b]|nr:hypothetical protein IP88_11925 [alpha proteobacterium AAP81b]